MDPQVFNAIVNFLKPENLMPHGQCLLWKPDLLGLHVLSDILIVLAYYSIPLALVQLVRKREDLTFGWIFILFGLFIFLCGTTHLVSIVTIWKPFYWFEGLLKFVTGLVSVTTAVLLWRLIPQAIQIPSSEQLKKANDDLLKEIEEKKRAENALKFAHETLEKTVSSRTAELEKSNQSLKHEILIRESTETQLKENKKRLETIFESGLDAIVVINTKGEILKWNKQAVTMFGWSEEQMLGKELAKTIIPHRYREAHLNGVKRFLETGKSKILNSRIEMEALNQQGHEFPIELAIAYSDLKDKSFVAFMSDITSRKTAEQDLIKAKEIAESSNLAKSEFLARMSHELRTPMNAILGFGQLLEADTEHPLHERQIGHLKRILKAGNHLLNLINEVLDLSKVESGEMELSLENINIVSLFKEVHSLMILSAEEVKVNLEIQPSEEVFVVADYIRLKQVLLNLVSNAIKYNKIGGTVFINFKINSEKVVINVSDTGMGIPDEKQTQIFQPFTRVAENLDKIEGTGIGLTISKRLVEKMRGKILFESIYGKGTTFTLEFPKGEKPSTALKLDVSNNDPVISTPKEDKATILYIEDNPVNLDLVVQILRRRSNITVISAPNAEEGIEMAREQKPSLIIMDIHLPGMDGLTAFKRLKNYEETKSIPIIALSADAMQVDMNKALSIGFNSYLTKPINLVEFMKTIDKILF